MKSLWLSAAALAVATLGASTARAQTLLYGMETGTPTNPDGFGPNGGGVTVSQSVVGATQGLASMQVSIVTGATFVGALNVSNLPAALTPPLATEQVDFDYTVTVPFTGGFSVAGITIFGFNAPLGQFGLQAQFAPLVHFEGKAIGTYHASIPLTGATNPLDFTANQTYNQIFTAGTPGPNQLNISGFEIFFNKSNDAAQVINIDNVTLGAVPEPTCLAFLGVGGLVLGARRRRA